MNFDTLFRLFSYISVLCGFVVLWVSGTFGVAETLTFLGVLVGSWFLEKTKWQIGEKVGTALIVAAMPVYFFFYRIHLFQFATTEIMIAGILRG